MRQNIEFKPTPELNDGLYKLQMAMKQPDKTKTGVHGSKYADLNDVANAIRRANKESNAGIAFVQSVNSELGPDGKEHMQVMTIITHTSGEYMMIEGLPVSGSNNSQEAMKAATYAKRGSLMAAFGVTPKDEDDDGEEMTELQKHLEGEKESRTRVQAKCIELLRTVDKNKLEMIWATLGMTNEGANQVKKLSFAKANALFGAIKYAMNEDLEEITND